MVKNYSFLNAGLALIYNGKRYLSKRGLADLLEENITEEPLYPIIHLKEDDVEIVVTHTSQVGEDFYSFVNGQNTTQGGTHLSASRKQWLVSSRTSLGRTSTTATSAMGCSCHQH